MAMSNTITTVYPAFENQENKKTPVMYDVIQTTGTGKATNGGLTIFSAITSTGNDFRLISLNYSISDPTTGAIACVDLAKDCIAVGPTTGSGVYSLNFGPWGAQVDVTTTTATVAIRMTVATGTVAFHAIGLKKR